MREHGMDGFGSIGTSTWDVSDGGDGDSVGCYDEFVGGADVGDDRSRYGDRVRNLVGMFIVDMFFFEWLVVGAGASVGKASVGWSSGE